MKAQTKLNEVNESNKRLLRLILELQIELNELKTNIGYDQAFRSEVQQIEMNLDFLMERVLNEY